MGISRALKFPSFAYNDYAQLTFYPSLRSLSFPFVSRNRFREHNSGPQ